MTMTLACVDAGQKNCPFVARGQTMEELMNDAGKHGREIHAYSDEFLNDPETIKLMKKGIKTE